MTAGRDGGRVRHEAGRGAARTVAALLLALCAILAPTQAMAADDPLGLLFLREKTGTAAGYVDDQGCAICHPATYASYQGVGMAQSLRTPAHAAPVEDFARAHVDHAPSQQHFDLVRRDDALLFRRWQTDAAGRPINRIEQKVDWVLGSGHRSRVYLYATPSGELFQLPVAWYAQEGRLGMAPGYDRPDHDGLTRRIRRECLFCHNAYPEQPAGSDARWSPQTFPAALPEGTGCQRCHGPGAAHVRAVIGNRSGEEIRASIVNPARLPAARRDEVCFQCHLLPAVAVIGSRRLGRGDYSFRPGQALDDYLLHVDTQERGGPAERFEINHHAWRLSQSPCYRRGGLTCIDCHDPHRPLASDPRLAAADAVCRRCHAPHSLAPASTGVAASCTGCHMPKRRTQDVVHVAMTDHRIQRPGTADLLAPLVEREPQVSDVQLLHPAAAGDAAQADLYRSLAIVGAGLGGDAGVAHLAERLAASVPADSPAWWDLAQAQLGRRQWRQAIATTAFLLARLPQDALARDWHGVARVGAGETAAGLEDLAAAAAAAPQSPEFAFNLGRVLHGLKRERDALAPLSRAIALRPTFVAAWITRAEVHAALGQRDAAVADYRQALAVDPRQTRAYQGLIPLLRAAGDTAEAQRYLEVGRRSAARPESLPTP